MKNLKKLQNKLPLTVRLEKNKAIIVDQTLLPSKLEFIELTNYQECIRAIKTMQVRGAVAIGMVGACGITLKALSCKSEGKQQFLTRLATTAEKIIAARPTAVDLKHDVMEIMSYAEGETIEEIRKNIYNATKELIERSYQESIKIAEIGNKIIPQKANIQTHCNAGSLATVWLGTALAPIYGAYVSGKKIKVWVDETRPVLQGARITAWEMQQAGIDYEIVVDSAKGYLMSKGMVDMVIVGADRIAANGDTANKIGTYPLALMAHEYGIPFYVAANYETIDFKSKTGKDIKIEERDKSEITDWTTFMNRKIAPTNAKAFNPAFDVTPVKYIKGIITERGILNPKKLK